MKKLGKKISFLTKIMLVIGLLISNLSSLSVVFAYEAPDNVRITLEEENLNIKYTEGTAEEVENLIVNVYETYTYLDSNMEERFAENLKFDTTEDGGLELTQPVSTFNEFDGTYKVVVEIYELIEVSSEPVNELESLDNFTPEVTKVMSEEPIATGTFEKEVTYKSGIELKVYNNGDSSIINATDGKYVLSENVDEIRVDAYMLPGGLAPSDEFLLGDTIYTAEEIQLLPFSSAHLFGDKLYGEYNIPVSVEVEKVVEEENSSETTEVTETLTDTVSEDANSLDTISSSEETTGNEILKYNTNINVMYGTYNGNTIELNNALQALDMIDTYTFYGNTKNGTLYKFINLTEEGNEIVTNTMLDLYKTLESFVNGTSIKYELLKNNEDVIKKYNDTYGVQETPEDEIESVSEESEEVVETVSLEDYLKEIILDETVKILLTSGDVTVSYSLIVLADLNNDNVLDENDVLELIEVVLKEDTDNKKADATGDGVVNSLDILYLTEVIKNKNWAISIPKEDATLDTELKVNASEEALVSGDEFTLEYILKLSTDEVSGFSGKFNYDKSALELVSIESLIDSVGNYNKDNGKFLYLGEESLALPEIEEEPIVPVEPEEEIVLLAEGEEDLEVPTVVTENHVVVRAKFRALKAGNHTVSIKDTEYYNLNTYLNVNAEETGVTVEVVKSDDNKLSYLEVAGTVIELVDDVFEYEITVKNEVTLVDLKYILSNVAASVTSTVYPEELAEGKNEVIITVSSESGITQDYKVVVIREEIKKETTTQVHYSDYQPNYNEPEQEPEPVVPVEPEEPKEEKENNSFNIIIIILIVLVICGLVYLIFKDDKEENNTNKEINKLKKDNNDFEGKTIKQVKENKSSNNKNKNTKNKSNQKNNNKKKEK